MNVELVIVSCFNHLPSIHCASGYKAVDSVRYPSTYKSAFNATRLWMMGYTNSFLLFFACKQNIIFDEKHDTGYHLTTATGQP